MRTLLEPNVSHRVHNVFFGGGGCQISCCPVPVENDHPCSTLCSSRHKKKACKKFPDHPETSAKFVLADGQSDVDPGV